MPGILELKQKDSKILGEANAIKDSVKPEDLTDELYDQIDAKLEESKAVRQEIVKLEKREATLASLDSGLKQLETIPEPKTIINPTPITTYDRVQDDPSKGFKSPRFFFMALMDHAMGRGMAEGLKYLRPQAVLGADEQSTFSDPHGGFLVPETFSPDLFKIDPESDPMGAFVRRIPMATPVVKIPAKVDKDHSTSVSGGLRVFRRAEADTTATSRMTFEEIKLETNGLFGITHVTEELMTDSPMSIAALLGAGFSDEFSNEIINERINGTGVGQFLGILNSDVLLTIGEETGQEVTTLVYENIVKMRARSWGYGGAIWIANHDTLPQLMLLNQSVGTGGAVVWQPSAREDHPDLLLGRPLIFSEYPATLGTIGDIILGTWSEYLEGILQPLTGAESIHVRFSNMERTFRFSMRNAGAPWWSSVLTPRNGATLSPFVVLESRV